MTKFPLVFGALFVAAPLALLLPGCSGGGLTGNLFPTPTPKPAVTATPATAQTSNFTLGNGQRAILKTIKNGTALTGTLQIVPTPTARQNAAIPFQFAFGSYAITGTVTASGAFTISGNFGAQGAFSMTGQLQSATQNGSYTLTVNGETESGILPKSGTPFPGVTPTPTSPPSGSYNLAANLTFSNVTSTTELVTTPITSFNDLKDGGSLTNISSASFPGFRGQSLSLNGATGRVTGNGTTRLLQLALSSSTTSDLLAGANKPFSAGQSIPASTSNLFQYSQSTVNGTSISIKVWRATGGNFIIKSVSAGAVTVEFQNVQVDPSPIFGGVGSFKLNGTLTATGLTVKTQG